MSSPTRPIRALDTPTGIRVEVLGYGRGDGYATVRALGKRLKFETPISRLHKPA